MARRRLDGGPALNLIIAVVVGAAVALGYWLAGESPTVVAIGGLLSASGGWAAVEVARAMKWI